VKGTIHTEQNRVYYQLALLVRTFDEEVAEQVKERSQYPEYVDATEILIEKSGPMAEALQEIFMSGGWVIPSPIIETLGDARREFLLCAAFAESGKCSPGATADRYAHDSIENLRSGMRMFKDLLDRREHDRE
jgi:hypothetical protein